MRNRSPRSVFKLFFIIPFDLLSMKSSHSHEVEPFFFGTDERKCLVRIRVLYNTSRDVVIIRYFLEIFSQHDILID